MTRKSALAMSYKLAKKEVRVQLPLSIVWNTSGVLKKLDNLPMAFISFKAFAAAEKKIEILFSLKRRARARVERGLLPNENNSQRIIARAAEPKCLTEVLLYCFTFVFFLLLLFIRPESL